MKFDRHRQTDRQICFLDPELHYLQYHLLNIEALTHGCTVRVLPLMN